MVYNHCLYFWASQLLLHTVQSGFCFDCSNEILWRLGSPACLMVPDILAVPEAANHSLLKLYSLSFCDAALSWVIPCDHCSSSYVESYSSTLLNVRDPGFVFLLITFLLLLSWCKSYCSFALLNFAIWYWNIFLNKCGYVMHHFNAHFLLYFFSDILLFILYVFRLENDIRLKANSSVFLTRVQTVH